MPLLAVFMGSVASALVGLFSRFMGFKAALRLASYTLWITILTALLVSVLICLNSLYAYVQSGHATSIATGAVNASNWYTLFFMGVGMFIPANAGAVVSCLGSVWLSMSIYKIQKDGIQNYSQ